MVCRLPSEAWPYVATVTLCFFAIWAKASTASGTFDTGTPISSASDTDTCPGLRTESDVMTDFLASVHLAISVLSWDGLTLTAPLASATSATVLRSRSTTSSVSPSTSTIIRESQSGSGFPRALLTAKTASESISSQDAGIRGLAMRSVMHFPADATSLNAQMQEADFFGLVVSLSVTSVITPSCPSDPHIRRASW